MDPKVKDYYKFNKYSNHSNNKFYTLDSPSLKTGCDLNVFNYTIENSSSRETSEVSDSTD